MPEHYGVLEVGTVLLVAQQNYRKIKSPLAGFVQDVSYSVGSNLPTDATFNVRKNGTSLWAADLTQRPKILGGQSSGSKLGINAAIAIGDLLQFDVDIMPAGGLPIPFFTNVTLYDTIALRNLVIYVTEELDDLEIANVDIPNMGRSWQLIDAEADRACWVRGYNSNAKRSADADRPINVDADENAGLAAELIFESPDDLVLGGWSAPDPQGHNLDDPQSTDGLFSIQNRSGVAHTVQITLNRLISER